MQADGFRGSWSVLGWPVAWLGGYGKVSALVARQRVEVTQILETRCFWIYWSGWLG
jgi:hypothetical protein